MPALRGHERFYNITTEMLHFSQLLEMWLVTLNNLADTGMDDNGYHVAGKVAD